MARTLLAVTAAVCGLLACSQPKSDASARSASSTASAPAALPAVPAAAPVAATVAPAAPPAVAVTVAPAAPPAVPVVAAPVAPAGPPRKAVKADGISITETSDGQVILKTTALWGEAIDATYTDCGYYNAAIPVITTQVSAARGKLLTRVCAKAATKPQP